MLEENDKSEPPLHAPRELSAWGLQPRLNKMHHQSRPAFPALQTKASKILRNFCNCFAWGDPFDLTAKGLARSSRKSSSTPRLPSSEALPRHFPVCASHDTRQWRPITPSPRLPDPAPPPSPRPCSTCQTHSLTAQSLSLLQGRHIQPKTRGPLVRAGGNDSDVDRTCRHGLRGLSQDVLRAQPR